MDNNSPEIKVISSLGQRLDLGLQIRIDRPNVEPAQNADEIQIIQWPTNPSDLIQFAMSSPLINGVKNVLADAISGGTVELKARDFTPNGEPIDRAAKAKEVDDEYNRAMNFIKNPTFAAEGNSSIGIQGFLRVAVQHIETIGNLFLEIRRDTKTFLPAALSILAPQMLSYAVQKKQDSTDVILRQNSYLSGTAKEFIAFGKRAKGDNKREFLHYRHSNMASGVYGLPAWTEAFGVAELDNAHTNYLKGFFKNHAMPRWAIEVYPDPTWTGVAATAKALEDTYKAVSGYLDANRGEMPGHMTLLRPGGIIVKFTQLSTENKDPVFTDTAKLARDQFLMVRHISMLDLGFSDGGYKATAETQSENFRKQVLDPVSSPIVELLNRILQTPEQTGLGITAWDFSIKFERVQDTLSKFEALLKACGVPFLTPDEARQIATYEPLGKEAATLQTPTTHMPMNTQNNAG